MRTTTTLALILLSIYIPSAYCDLPVHCLKHQLVGNWQFDLSEPKGKSHERVPCGHHTPDNAATSYAAMATEFVSNNSMNIRLETDNSAVDTDGKASAGDWTMIYDEGFEAKVGSIKYMAFSKYAPDGDGGFESYCGETLVGWWHDTSKMEKGCFRGQKSENVQKQKSGEDMRKVVAPDEAQKKDVGAKGFLQSDLVNETFDSFPTISANDLMGEQKNFSDMSAAQLDSNLDNLLEESVTKNPDTNLDFLELHAEFSDHQRVVDRLNTIENKQWTAAVPDNFAELNLSEMNRRAGRKKWAGKGVSFADISEEKKNKKKFYEADDTSDMPKELTWEDYLNEPYQQGDCGSCYTMATMQMLQARLSIKNNKQVKLSTQHVLDCNYFNQGCDGGYPYLVGKFAEEFELVPEDCAPYTAMDGQCGKCDVSKLDEFYRVGEYRYIGGQYGKSREREMMEEIQNNGPIVVSFEPAYDFMYYSGGIYHSVDAADWIKDNEKQPEWEKVDHSVLAYGWGETDDGQKYWLVQNSWGKGWGENGRFRMRRGTDDSNIESMGEAMDPIVVKSYGGNVSLVEKNGFLGMMTEQKKSKIRY